MASSSDDDDEHIFDDQSSESDSSDGFTLERPGAYAIGLGSRDSSRCIPIWDPTERNSSFVAFANSSDRRRLNRRPSNGLSTIESSAEFTRQSTIHSVDNGYSVDDNEDEPYDLTPTGGRQVSQEISQIQFTHQASLALTALTSAESDMMPISGVDERKRWKSYRIRILFAITVLLLLIGIVIGIIIAAAMGTQQQGKKSVTGGNSNGGANEQSSGKLNDPCNSFEHLTMLDRCICDGNVIEDEIDREAQLLFTHFQEMLGLTGTTKLGRKCNDASSFALFWLATGENLNESSKIIARFSLTKFYFHFGPFGGNSTNWITSADECDWFGVECDDSGQVTGLLLRKNSLTGEVSLESMDSIVALNLTKLDISRNNLPGNLNFALKITDIEILDCSMNMFSGEIPPEVALLRNLREFRIEENNRLSGELPSDLFRIETLEVIAIGPNPSMRGSLPEDLSRLTRLELLWLGEMDLFGSIPSSIGLLTNLREIDFFSIAMEGSLPDEIGLLTGLTFLNVLDAGIEGTIPSSIQKLTRLEVFALTDLFLSGALPQGLGMLTMLKDLDLSSNFLTGSIPGEWRNLGMLGK